jgi:phytoene dehydrogenase-like protein
MAQTACASVVFGLSAWPSFAGVAVPPNGRFVLAEQLETYDVAHAASRAGRLPEELTLEFVIPSAADPQLAPMGQHVMSVLVRPVPAMPEGGWQRMKESLAARVIAALDNVLPGFSRLVVAMEMLTPDESLRRFGHNGGHERILERLLADWRARIATPIAGLFLCGRDAEPVPAVSARAARIAVALALREPRA